jgi:ATP-dependent Lon protease
MDEVPQILPVLPMRETVLFPDVVTPIVVGRERSKRLVEDVLSKTHEKLIGLLSLRDASIEEPGPDDLYEVGTVARIVQKFSFPDETIRVVVEGVARFRVTGWESTDPFLSARIEPVEDQRTERTSEVEALVRSLLGTFQQMVQLAPYIPDQLLGAAINISSPESLADFLAGAVNIGVEERQKVLETADVPERLRLVARLLNQELDLLQTGAKINEQMVSELSHDQREIFLRRQLDAIRRELGELDESHEEIQELRRRIQQASPPDHVRTEADRELARLEKIPPQSPEHAVIRSRLEWFADLPWSTRTEDRLDIEGASRILNEDHYGLEEVKERILEFLAVQTLRGRQPHDETPVRQRGPILCFVGPPGVGKTSLGQSIARALGRTFVRMSLGGVRDEADIRGHRRTYIGSLPGRVVQALRRAGSMNPVVMLDEIDKLGVDFRGDPAAALLEVLDPEQNSSFTDHYLDVELDLSNVMFITTANILETIPPALLDRMEVLRLAGYTEPEKVEIARRYLVPRQRVEHGLTEEAFSIDDDAIGLIISEYTHEAGVRSLERQIATLARKAAKRIISGETVAIDLAGVREMLGKRRFKPTVAEERDDVGVASGLAVTGAGGDVLFVEVALVPGKGGLTLTGQLGDIMQESARAASTYTRGRVRSDWWERSDVHIHVPAGAVPKDGPSAGVTMTTALYSAVTGRPVRKDVGMTGEVTLRGHVLAIGGVKEKVLAAHRAGLTTVILPEDNEADLDEVPENVRAELDVHLVSHMDQVLAVALAPAPHEELRPAS